jgi:hypothetical protein
VHRSWTNDEAAALAWELLSFRVRDDLVGEAGLPPGRYVEVVAAAVLAALAAPVSGRGRSVYFDGKEFRGVGRGEYLETETRETWTEIRGLPDRVDERVTYG